MSSVDQMANSGMPQFGLVVDDRESALAEALHANYPSVALSCARLTTADVHVVQNGEVVLVLERKTRADLSASLKDGRFHSQRARMVSEYGQHCVAYVIEGGTAWDEAEAGAELALCMRDRLPVFWSCDVHDTAALVCRLARSELTHRPTPPLNENGVRKASATTACPERSLAAMMRCIVGVSARRAATIAAHFKSMKELALASEADAQGLITHISDLRDKSGGNRFGKTLAHRVVVCIGAHP